MSLRQILKSQLPSAAASQTLDLVGEGHPPPEPADAPAAGALKTIFTGKDLSKDVLASFVVLVVALPLCMGIAIASGMPPAAGLVTGIVGGALVGFFAGQPLQVSGPAAGMAVIVWGIVQSQGAAGLGAACFLAGGLQVLGGKLRLGRWFRAVPPAVIHAVLAGIGLLIILSQLHVVADLKPAGGAIANFLALPDVVLSALGAGSGHQQAFVIGCVSFATILLWNKFRPERLKLVPGPLLGVLVGMALAAAMGANVKYISVPGNLIGGLSGFSMDTLKLFTHTDVYASALILAFIATTETLLTAGAVETMSPENPTQYDKELVAQGIGNMVCGALGALPMTGVGVRSTANVTAGARTRRSTMLHGLWLGVLSIAIPQVLELIPIASLAAVLIGTGIKLINIEEIRSLRAQGKGQLAVYGVTLALILGHDLLVGAIAGLVMAFVVLAWRLSEFQVTVVADTLSDADSTEPAGQCLVLTGMGTFLRLPELASGVETLSKAGMVRFDTSQLRYLDPACRTYLTALERKLHSEGRLVMTAAPNGTSVVAADGKTPFAAAFKLDAESAVGFRKAA